MRKGMKKQQDVEPVRRQRRPSRELVQELEAELTQLNKKLFHNLRSLANKAVSNFLLFFFFLFFVCVFGCRLFLCCAKAISSLFVCV